MWTFSIPWNLKPIVVQALANPMIGSCFVLTLIFSFFVLVSCASFHEVCEQGDIDVLSNILEDKTFDVNEFDSDGLTALGSVASKKYNHQSSLKIANILLNHPNIDFEKGSINDESPLFLAITHGNFPLASRLLEIPDLRVNPKAPRHSFCTPLLAAIKISGEIETIRTEALKLIKKLLNHEKININVSCKKLIPFLEITKYADEATLMVLLNHQISDPNAVDEDGNGIFHLLAKFDPVPFAVLDRLRSLGTFDINMTNKDRNTFAHLMASRVNNPNALPIVLKLLAIKRISLNIVNEKGELPLHIILKTMIAEERVDQKRLHSIFQALDDRSDFIALQAEDENGDTVVHLLVKLLVSGYSFDRLAFKFITVAPFNKFDLDSQNKQGQTVLHLLLGSSADPLLVDQLLAISILKYKVNPNITDVDGYTAPQLALKNGNPQYLLNIFSSALQEEFILRMMRNPIRNFPDEPLAHMLDKDGFLLNAIEKKWHKAAEILIKNPRFGYTPKVISSSRIFLEKAIDSFNHKMCIQIWPLYRDNIDFERDAEFLQTLLYSGIQYIYEDLESKGFSLGGIDGNSKDHWAAFHGWTDYLAKNLEHIKVNSSNQKGMTLLNLALSGRSSLKQVKETIRLLFKKPAKIDLFELYNENRLSIDLFSPEIIETFIQSAFDQFLEQKDPNHRDLILTNFERLRLLRYKQTIADGINKSFQLKFADFEYLLGHLSAERIDAFYKKIIRPVSGSVDFNEMTIASRSALMKSAMEEIDRLENKGINLADKRIYVKFIGEKGGDAGALGREFFYDVMEEIFENYKDLFEEIGEYDAFVNVKAFNQADVTEEMIQIYKFMGKILGLSLLNQCNLPKRFSHLLLRQLIGLPPTWRDSEPLDKTVFKAAEGNINLSEDDFKNLNVTYFDIRTEMLPSELDEGEALDDENIVKYKHREQVYTRCTIAIFLDDRTRQVAAMKEGLNSIISDENLSALFPADLQALITGSSNIDLKDWMDNTEYAGIYKTYRDEHNGEDHPTIKFFWKFLEEHPEEKLRLFIYATGYRLVPSGGMGKLKDGRKFSIDSLQRHPLDAVDGNGNLINDTYYPDTVSCFFILKLPPYSTQEILTERTKFALDKYYGFQNI